MYITKDIPLAGADIRNVLIHDTTLRDGEQMPGVVFTPDEKLALATKSIEFGTDLMDIMPAVSESEQRVTRRLAEMFPQKISATCRAKREDIELAAKLGVRRVTLFTPLSDIHLKYKLGISRDENLQRSLEIIDYARSFGMAVDFAGEDATRADYSYLTDFLQALGHKIEIFYIADTVGFLTPSTTRILVSKLKNSCRCKLGLHVHNDFGLATANTIEGLRAGADVFSGTFTGIGERAGNAPIEEVCTALRYLYSTELDVGYDMLSEICALVQRCSGINLQPHKPISGSNAFCHESGIHADGVIKHPATYEPFDPADVGAVRKFYFGKHSGNAVLRHFFSDLTEHERHGLLAVIKRAAERQKRSFSAEELSELVAALRERSMWAGRLRNVLRFAHHQPRMVTCQ